MSDDAETTAETDTAADPPKRPSTSFFEGLTDVADYFSGPNQLLQRIADFASADGLPVTLFLQGSTIAGHITSAQKFFRWLGESYRQASADSALDGELPEWADQFAKTMFDDPADEVDQDIADDIRAHEESGAKHARTLLARQIFLKDAFFTVPGATSIRREYVCVQLSHVAGWTFGTTSWN